MKMNTYLNYGGNCAEAFRFYEKHLGGKIGMMMTYGQSPDQTNVKPEHAHFALHASITIGTTVLMASDVDPQRFQPMRSVYLSLSVDTDAEAERIYNLLADGGQVYMPMAETFFATRFGQLRDQFGTSWMILHERPMPSHP
ncbi:MAG TPA: VOC family protein [Terracidiphilus sp.]|jgi:PhnB protein|nr:VOC family protein [Terracidiphilus sp.]